jgi:hypothetical protein
VVASDIMAILVEAVEKECPFGRAFGVEVWNNNVAYESEDGKIWFEKENGFEVPLKDKLKPYFIELRKKNPIGVNYIKINLI